SSRRGVDRMAAILVPVVVEAGDAKAEPRRRVDLPGDLVSERRHAADRDRPEVMAALADLPEPEPQDRAEEREQRRGADEPSDRRDARELGRRLRDESEEEEDRSDDDPSAPQADELAPKAVATPGGVEVRRLRREVENDDRDRGSGRFERSESPVPPHARREE